MKKALFILSLLFPVFWFTYQQQGFSEYQEEFWTTSFNCQGQCIILVGETDTYDMLTIEWTITGKWILWFGFLVGQQVIPGSLIEINWNKPINQQFIFSESPAFTKIPEKTQLVVIMEGELQGKTKIFPDIITIGQKISKWWNDFWIREKYWYYSINLLYGPKILWKSFMQIRNKWYIYIIILWVVYYVIKTKKTKIKDFFIYTSLVFFIIAGSRFLYDSYGIYKDDLAFANKPKDQRIFRNYQDIPSFVEFIKENIQTGTLINFVSYQERPYPEFAKYQLWPDIKVDIFTKKEFTPGTKFIAVYDIWKFKLQEGNLIDTTNNQIVLRGVKIIKQYNAFSYIWEIFN